MQVTAGTDDPVCCLGEGTVNRASHHERPAGDAPPSVPSPPSAFETMRFEPGVGPLRLEAHLARMARTCAYLGQPFSQDEARGALGRALASETTPRRVRLRMRANGSFAVDVTPLEVSPLDVSTLDGAPRDGAPRDGAPPDGEPVHACAPPSYLPPTGPPVGEVALAFARVDERNPLLRHKTTARSLYDAATRVARAAGLLDVLFLNRRDELADGAISTVFVRTTAGLFTPPLASGALPGVLRGELLAAGIAGERVLTLDDLDGAEAVFLGSALRGLRRVSIAREAVAVDSRDR
jgi:branched-subunit amino acid aminotransferase/4-amino-4-deoxychorismate lyase